MMQNDFTINLDDLTATHKPTGICWTFKKLKDGSYDGRATVRDKSIKSDAQALARLSREAGDAFIDAINKRNRDAKNKS